MAATTLLVSAGFSMLSAGAFLLVGRELSQRQLAGAAGRASTAFTLWWYLLAASTLVGGIQTLVAWTGWTSLPLWAALQDLNLLAIVAALCGLLYYLVYLFTGREGILKPMIGAYIVYYGYLLFLIRSAGPTGVEVGAWTTTLTYENQAVLEGPLATVALVLLVAPQILGALALFSTFFRFEDRTRRYRVALVSWAIIIWFSTSLVAPAVGASGTTWWEIASRSISLAAALTVLAAYRPPAFIQARLSVEPVAREAG